jgi:hypothetical protein
VDVADAMGVLGLNIVLKLEIIARLILNPRVDAVLLLSTSFSEELNANAHLEYLSYNHRKTYLHRYNPLKLEYSSSRVRYHRHRVRILVCIFSSAVIRLRFQFPIFKF